MEITDTHIHADHWSDLTELELAEWTRRSPFFSPRELACKGSGILHVGLGALAGLNLVRDLNDGPLIVNSAYRNPAHNAAVGGGLNSQHLKGVAFDLAIDDLVTGAKIERLAIEAGFSGIGRYSNFIHIDMRPPKPSGEIYEWGLPSWD